MGKLMGLQWAKIRCIGCEKTYGIQQAIFACESCGEPVEVELDLAKFSWHDIHRRMSHRQIGVWRYRELLPVLPYTEIVTLGEGGTNLHRAKRFGERLGFRFLYVKNEGENPTGSFKDRGMTVGVTKAKEIGVKRVICASTGNTSASLAAYAALGGLQCLVIVPSGKIALGKMAQALMYGALVIGVKGNFDQALDLVVEAQREMGFYMLNSINPFRYEGQKTGAYELYDQLGGRVPDWLICPVGNGANIAAYWKGFEELYGLGAIDRLPKMIGVQAEGAAPIANAWIEGKQEIEPVAKPETIATAIRIGRPANWKKTLRAIRDSKGMALIVTDEMILKAQHELAKNEGIFVEPASAASIAGLKILTEQGMISSDELVVCVTSGHGLKDPDAVLQTFTHQLIEIRADLRDLKEVINKNMGAST